MLLRGGVSRAHIFSVHLFYAVCYKKSTGGTKSRESLLLRKGAGFPALRHRGGEDKM
jgi:hypothetical protein